MKWIAWVLSAGMLIFIVPIAIRAILRLIMAARLRLPGEQAIACDEIVTLNGVRQFIQIRGEDRRNPVLLVIHGGPGYALSGTAYRYQRRLERTYTVVNWDQRCVGKTASISGASSTPPITMDNIIGDAEALAVYLKQRLDKPRIVVLGHSWGTVVGSQLALKCPEHVLTYIGLGQVVSMWENESDCFNHTDRLAKERNDKALLEQLDQLRPYPSQTSDSVPKLLRMTRLKYRCGYASTRYSSIIGSLLKSDIWALFNPSYTWRDFRNMNNGLPYLPMMADDLWHFDLAKVSTEYKMPFFTITGDNDWQTPMTVARRYFDKVSAPQKEYFVIPNSGHMTQFDNTEAFSDVMCGPIFQAVAQAIEAAT